MTPQTVTWEQRLFCLLSRSFKIFLLGKSKSTIGESPNFGINRDNLQPMWLKNSGSIINQASKSESEQSFSSSVLPSKQAQRHRRRRTERPASSTAHGPSIKDTVPGTSPTIVFVTFLAVVRCLRNYSPAAESHLR
jgi:hypothetical protein